MNETELNGSKPTGTSDQTDGPAKESQDYIDVFGKTVQTVQNANAKVVNPIENGSGDRQCTEGIGSAKQMDCVPSTSDMKILTNQGPVAVVQDNGMQDMVSDSNMLDDPSCETSQTRKVSNIKDNTTSIDTKHNDNVLNRRVLCKCQACKRESLQGIDSAGFTEQSELQKVGIVLSPEAVSATVVVSPETNFEREITICSESYQTSVTSTELLADSEVITFGDTNITDADKAAKLFEDKSDTPVVFIRSILKELAEAAAAVSPTTANEKWWNEENDLQPGSTTSTPPNTLIFPTTMGSEDEMQTYVPITFGTFGKPIDQLYEYESSLASFLTGILKEVVELKYQDPGRKRTVQNDDVACTSSSCVAGEGSSVNCRRKDRSIETLGESVLEISEIFKRDVSMAVKLDSVEEVLNEPTEFESEISESEKAEDDDVITASSFFSEDDTSAVHEQNEQCRELERKKEIDIMVTYREQLPRDRDPYDSSSSITDVSSVEHEDILPTSTSSSEKSEDADSHAADANSASDERSDPEDEIYSRSMAGPMQIIVEEDETIEETSSASLSVYDESFSDDMEQNHGWVTNSNGNWNNYDNQLNILWQATTTNQGVLNYINAIVNNGFLDRVDVSLMKIKNSAIVEVCAFSRCKQFTAFFGIVEEQDIEIKQLNTREEIENLINMRRFRIYGALMQVKPHFMA